MLNVPVSTNLTLEYLQRHKHTILCTHAGFESNVDRCGWCNHVMQLSGTRQEVTGFVKVGIPKKNKIYWEHTRNTRIYTALQK